MSAYMKVRLGVCLSVLFLSFELSWCRSRMHFVVLLCNCLSTFFKSIHLCNYIRIFMSNDVLYYFMFVCVYGVCDIAMSLCSQRLKTFFNCIQVALN